MKTSLQATILIAALSQASFPVGSEIKRSKWSQANSIEMEKSSNKLRDSLLIESTSEFDVSAATSASGQTRSNDALLSESTSEVDVSASGQTRSNAKIKSQEGKAQPQRME